LEGEKPFCPKNNIILEEAIAVILRASGILTNAQAEEIRQDIYHGRITEKLSDDVSPKNIDGSVYSFYPDLQKALNYNINELDNNGVQKVYKLIELKDNKIFPKRNISKEDFLKIAFVALKANSCKDSVPNEIALKIDIFDKKCSSNTKNCTKSNLQDSNNIYDFLSNLKNTCSK
jgi:hypothetical protein